MVKIKNLLLFALVLTLTPGIRAQSISFPDDDIERGYYLRPYLRYEAEAGSCETDGIFLDATYDQRKLQSEASNQSAVQLINRNSYVQWTNEMEADGLTIRFSLPDNAEGTGTTGNLAIYIDGDSIGTLSLDSYWAWQYILFSGSKYPDNMPNTSTKFPRMRFDEMHMKLEQKIPANASIRLVKTDDNEVPYTIDFIELEEVPEAITFESIADENKVMYTPGDGALHVFIAQNLGKTIFLPEGRYEVGNRIYINGDNTKLTGAGMWHTEVYFSASSDERSTYNQRGIEAYGSNVEVKGLYLNTVNNKRYYDNDPAYQVGKGLMGSFGSGSIIQDLWVEHFECGGWIEGADQLQIAHCRFRNNYADGMNLSNGCVNSVVEHSSYRNNGDDDMASWSRASGMCENNEYRYSITENNWRASGLGFFGGKQNRAHHLVIIDPMEAGFRVTCDFPGMPFSDEGYSEFYEISVYKGGVQGGSVGVYGDLWGNQQGALQIFSTSQYDLTNIKIYQIDFHDSKNDAIFIGSTSRNINNLVLRDVRIDGTGRYGIYYYNPKGNGFYCNIRYDNIGGSSNTSALPSSFSFIEDCSNSVLSDLKALDINLFSRDGTLYISGQQPTMVSVYDIWGRKHYQSHLAAGLIAVHNLDVGIYLVRWDENQTRKVLVL